eukprot:GEMP01003559.1.p1 GENE.GEMP01003559.1~~GEMP01003559.1.p1  ORF type:complete len:746 (+),score=145.90 GEMP01003559.1:519-2756(+)
MRVRHLQSHLHDQNMIHTGKLSDIHGLRIGIDAVFWLRSIQALKDPFADALGGVPPGIFGYVDKELDQFKTASITPIFVFQGMAPPPQQLYLANRMDQQTDMAWNFLAKGLKSDAQKCFAVSTSRINSDFVYFIFHHLKNRGYECFQAPYFAGSQLAHFALEGMLHAVFGPPGLLLYGVPKILIALDFAKDSFDWLDLSFILSTWDMQLNQFIDACILAGTDYCLTYPYLNQTADRGSRFNFDAAVFIIKQLPLINWLQAFPTDDMRNDHVDGYCVCKVLLHHSPVLHVHDQAVRPLSRNPSRGFRGEGPDIPHDFASIMGEKLPDALYLLMCKGIISSKLPQALAKGEWTDKTQPLVDTQEFRQLLADLQQYREKALGLVARHLHPNFWRKRIIRRVFFDGSLRQNNASNVNGCTRLEPMEPSGMSCLRWKFSVEDVENELQRQGADVVDFTFCLNWHAHDFVTEGPLCRNLTKGGDSQLIGHTQDAVCALAYFMLLEQLELISADGGMTVLQNVLKDTPSKFQEPCLVALELMKFGVLSGEPFDAGAPERPFPFQIGYPTQSQLVDGNTKAMYLLTRVVSLVPMKLRTDMWNADVNFDLAAFHSIVRVLKRTLRQLTEACVTSIFLSDLSKTSLLPNGFMSTSFEKPETSQLPAFMLSRSCMGIVARYFLNYKADPGCLAKELHHKFPCCQQPLADLKVGFEFWGEFKRCVEIIAEPLDAQELLVEMNLATSILRVQRKKLDV